MNSRTGVRTLSSHAKTESEHGVADNRDKKKCRHRLEG